MENDPKPPTSTFVQTEAERVEAESNELIQKLHRDKANGVGQRLRTRQERKAIGKEKGREWRVPAYGGHQPSRTTTRYFTKLYYVFGFKDAQRAAPFMCKGVNDD